MLRLFAVLIRGPSHWSLLPTHLVVVVASLVEVVILQNSRTSELFFFLKNKSTKNTRALVGNFARMLTEFKSSEEKQMLGPQSEEISWPRNAKNKQAKKQLFPIEERRRRRRSRSEEICSNSSDQN